MKKIMILVSLLAISALHAGPHLYDDLHDAIQDRNITKMRSILDQIADPNGAISLGAITGLTPLGSAILNNNIEAVQELLNNPKSKDKINVNKPITFAGGKPSQTPLKFLNNPLVEPGPNSGQIKDLLLQHGAHE